MKHLRNLSLVAALAVFLILAVAGCDGLKSPTAPVTQDLVPDANAEDIVNATCSTVCKQVTLWSVDFIPMVPPGTWAASQNSGQAAAFMAANYKRGNWYTSRPAEIIQQMSYENAWLADHYGNQFRNNNGYFTTPAQLLAMLKGHWKETGAFSAAPATEMAIYGSLQTNRPMLVQVRKNMGATGALVWMVVIGYRPEGCCNLPASVWVNDPTRPDGKSMWYPIAAFRASWASTGKVAIFVP